MKTLIYSLVPTVAAFNTVSKFTREAEIKHGRVAMVSSLAIPLLDTLNPEVLGVNYVNSLDPILQLGLLAVVGCSEFAQLNYAYNFPDEVSNWFSLKDDHTPGDYNFNPLNLPGKPTDELFIGRIAMISVVCEMANELSVGEPILKHI